MTTEKTREWQRAHPENMRANAKRWRDRNKDRCNAYAHEYYLRKKALKKGEKHDGNLRTDQGRE